ncbi:hypothetical protein [uncultured Brevundimonas sp.]|uniref:hypothetical protein n=1 Tax=uncultured Brevundimonas sp. TaxID=213418 RepID=UPI0030EE9F13|tara:strand:+ start:214 stop:402 length:189 start_codon:yes stop_codon:yes gene_type:complete
MDHSISAQDCRRKLSDLIQQAVPEPDPERRQALMVMADHWGELLRLRSPSPDDHQRRPSSRQ